MYCVQKKTPDLRVRQVSCRSEQDEAERHEPGALSVWTEQGAEFGKEGVRDEVEEEAESEHLQVRQTALGQGDGRVEAELEKHLEEAHARDHAGMSRKREEDDEVEAMEPDSHQQDWGKR